MIYVDCDGVLFDFHSTFFKAIGREVPNYPKGADIHEALNISKGELYRLFDKAGESFWENIPLFPYAMDLWKFLNSLGHEVKLLTSTINNKTAATYRANLIKKYFGQDFTAYIIDANKAKYATPNSLLIDDREKVLCPFIWAGGYGYLWAQPWNRHIERPYEDRLGSIKYALQQIGNTEYPNNHYMSVCKFKCSDDCLAMHFEASCTECGMFGKK